MTHSTRHPRVFLVLLATGLVACVRTPTQAEVHGAAATNPATAISALATATPPPVPTETPIPATLTPTPMALSATDRKDVLRAFQVMTMMEAAAHATLKGAQLAQSDDPNDPFKASLRKLGAYMLLSLAGGEMQKVTPPITLRPFWNDVIAAYNDTADLINRWDDKEMEPAEIADEMVDVVDRLQTTVDNAEAALILVYAWDPGELAQTRQEMLDSADEMFATPTPTP